MRDAFRHYWFHLVPKALVDRHGTSLHLGHLEGFPAVALEQGAYGRFALPYLEEVVPTRGTWSEVPMGQDVLLDSTSADRLRQACEAMIARVSGTSAEVEDRATLDLAERPELIGVLHRLKGLAGRLHDDTLSLLVAHWPERVIPETPLIESRLPPAARRA